MAPRKHGFETPLDKHQVISFFLFGFLVIGTYVLFMPFVEGLGLRWALVAAYSVFVFFVVVTDYYTSVTDPSDEGLHGADHGEYYCALCQASVCRSSKHCRSCDRCTEGFDHHCKWLNNCIGSANYRPFFLLVITTVGMLTLQFAWGAYLFILTFTDVNAMQASVSAKYNGAIQFHGWQAALAIYMVVLGGCIAMLGELLFFHLVLIYKGMTTYDYIMAQREGGAAVTASRLNPITGSGGDGPQPKGWKRHAALLCRSTKVVDSTGPRPVTVPKARKQISLNPCAALSTTRLPGDPRSWGKEDALMKGGGKGLDRPLHSTSADVLIKAEDMRSAAAAAPVVEQSRGGGGRIVLGQDDGRAANGGGRGGDGGGVSQDIASAIAAAQAAAAVAEAGRAMRAYGGGGGGGGGDGSSSKGEGPHSALLGPGQVGSGNGGGSGTPTKSNAGCTCASDAEAPQHSPKAGGNNGPSSPLHFLQFHSISPPPNTSHLSPGSGLKPHAPVGGYVAAGYRPPPMQLSPSQLAGSAAVTSPLQPGGQAVAPPGQLLSPANSPTSHSAHRHQHGHIRQPPSQLPSSPAATAPLPSVHMFPALPLSPVGAQLPASPPQQQQQQQWTQSQPQAPSQSSTQSTMQLSPHQQQQAQAIAAYASSPSLAAYIAPTLSSHPSPPPYPAVASSTSSTSGTTVPPGNHLGGFSADSSSSLSVPPTSAPALPTSQQGSIETLTRSSGSGQQHQQQHSSNSRQHSQQQQLQHQQCNSNNGTLLPPLQPTVRMSASGSGRLSALPPLSQVSLGNLRTATAT